MAPPLRERWINELGFCRVIKVWKSLRSADFNTEGKDLSCCWLEELCLFRSGWAVVTSICLPFFNLQAGEKPNAPPLSYHMSLNMLIAKWINAHHLQPCLGGFWGEEPRSQRWWAQLTQKCPTERQLGCTGKSVGGAGTAHSGNRLRPISHRHRVGVTSWSACQIDSSVMKNDHLRSASMRDVPD